MERTIGRVNHASVFADQGTEIMSAYATITEGNQFYPPSYVPANGADYVYSPSRTYFAVLEENGDFTTYGGESPDDPKKVKVWSTNSGSRLPSGYKVVMLTIRSGPFDRNWKNIQIFGHDPNKGSTPTLLWGSGGSRDLTSPMQAQVGDDGKLTLVQNNQEVWNNGFSDPVVEYSVESIEYDIPNGKIKTDAHIDVLEQSLTNNVDKDQKMTMSKQTSTGVTSSWSNATGFTATIGGEVTAGVPGVASAKVTMSASVTNTFTLGGSSSTTQTIGFSFDLTVPPHKTYRGWAEVRQAEFEVPYTVVGELRFRSGRKARGKLSGTYQGKAGYIGTYHVDEVKDGLATPAMVFRMESPSGIPEAYTLPENDAAPAQ